MVNLMNLLTRMRQAWLTLTAPPPVVDPTPHLAPPAPEVDDGVDYTLPMPLPGYLRRALQEGDQLTSYVESAAQTYASQFGNPYRSGFDLPILPTTEDPLEEWDWATRERVLSNCHAAYQRNPLANSIVQFTRDFVVGDGFNIAAQNKEVLAVLEEFIEDPDNALREYEQQAPVDLQVDGELILRLFEDEERVIAVPQRPWELHYIRTEPGFFRRPQLYHFQREIRAGDDWTQSPRWEHEDVPAESIIYGAINRHSYELRGRPELYRMLPWLRADKEFVEENARAYKWRKAIYWHVKVRSASQAMLDAIRAIWRKPPPPGSAYISSDNQELMGVSNPADTGDGAGIGRSIRLMNILGARLPEYFFADGQNANLASATKQELPALAKFESMQQTLLRQLWYPLFRRVIEKAVASGRLTAIVEVQNAEGHPVYEPIDPARPDVQPPKVDPIAAVDAFEVTYEPITSQNLLTMTQAYTLMMTNGIASTQTAQEKLGLDPTLERKRTLAEAAQDSVDRTRGIIPDEAPDPLRDLKRERDRLRDEADDEDAAAGEPDEREEPEAMR